MFQNYNNLHPSEHSFENESDDKNFAVHFHRLSRKERSSASEVELERILDETIRALAKYATSSFQKVN